MTLTLDFQGKFFKYLYLRNGQANWQFLSFITMTVAEVRSKDLVESYRGDVSVPSICLVY